jgi:hypothetical protein
MSSEGKSSKKKSKKKSKKNQKKNQKKIITFKVLMRDIFLNDLYSVNLKFNGFK